MTAPTASRAAELISLLALQPHPEGGHYRELFRSPHDVQPQDPRGPRSALTSIDFLLVQGQCSAWHRVASDEAWHLLEGGPLVLWLLAPDGAQLERHELAPASSSGTPRHVVPAGWWQTAEPLGEFAYVGATVGPGFDFEDFTFLRAHADEVQRLRELQPDLLRLL